MAELSKNITAPNLVTSQAKNLPMDLAALGDGPPDGALAGWSWPSDYDAYHVLSREVIDTMVACVVAFDANDNLAAVLRAKTYDIVTDLAFVGRLAFDIANARRAGHILQFDQRASPLLAFLDAGNNLAPFPMPRIWHHPVDTRLATQARRIARRARSHARAMLSGADRIDVHNRNNLVNSVLAANDCAAIDWPVTNHGWPEAGPLPPTLENMATALADVYGQAISRFIGDAKLCATLTALGRYLIEHHLAKAFFDLDLLERHIRHRALGTMLLSGTPKHLGRLAGWLYRRAGKSVVRCAHGGERVFFADYEWGLAEFPDCDTYYAHSAGERDALTQRLRDGNTALVDPDNAIEVRSIGSSHHLDLLERAHQRGRRERSGTVLYVAGGYLGEQLGDFPNRKPPDVLYLDWQIDLIRALQGLGYRVVAKLHPAGIDREARYLAHYADAIVEGLFDPLATDGDCLIFDFAGTAFFDALATHTPMVLADTGVRPFDMSTRTDLERRCPIVPGARDEHGRFRIDRACLGEAIETAVSAPNCPSDFYDRYFDA